MIIVDSTVWIGYFRGERNPHTDWLDLHMAHDRLGLTDLNLCEVLQGIPDDETFLQARHHLSQFQIFNAGGEALAVNAAQNYRNLRTHGYTVRKTMDCLIATFCLREGHALLHRDHDFDAFEKYLDLLVIHPEH